MKNIFLLNIIINITLIIKKKIKYISRNHRIKECLVSKALLRKLRANLNYNQNHHRD